MENEIKLGEYCITKNGLIAKLIEPQVYEINDKECIEFLEDIVKHSSNLIDLIQCGDYVNGEYVMHIDNNIENYGDKTIITELNKRYFESQIIKVATKEMMESISYKVTKMW